MTLTRLLGIEHPIVQAPMAGSQDAALAIAVSSAGGLGSLPCAMLSLDAARDEIARIRSQTSRPFNVNFFCHDAPAENTRRETEWRRALQPFFDELGIDSTSTATAPRREPFSAATVDMLEELKPGIVSFHFGLPARELLTKVKSWGTTVLATATTVREADWLEANGADVIIAQGTEAGGHRGSFLSEDLTEQAGTFALLPQIAARVTLPVIAAGGIASASGVAAAMRLGAAGVQLGTSYLLCPEANTSATHRAALKSDAAVHTAITNVFTGRPARGIVNRLVRELGPISETAPQFPLAASALIALRAHCEKSGNGEFSPLWAGQNVSGCAEIPA